MSVNVLERNVTRRHLFFILTAQQEGILEARKSPLAHCLLGDYYLSLEEYESAVECTRKGLKLASAEAKKTDLSFQRWVTSPQHQRNLTD